MFIKYSNPIVETDFADVEIYVASDHVTIIWQDDGHAEWFEDFKTIQEAWREAYSLFRYEQRLHPDWMIALVY